MKAIELAGLAQSAAAAPRRRVHLNLHDDLADPVQRVVIALEPGTYVRPHRHAGRVWELFALLEGELAVLTFDAEGAVLQRQEMRSGGARLVQLPAGAWHSLVALVPGTVALEVKPGPYCPASDKQFAAWAPSEGEAGAVAMVRWMERAVAGATPPAPPPPEPAAPDPRRD